MVGFWHITKYLKRTNSYFNLLYDISGAKTLPNMFERYAFFKFMLFRNYHPIENNIIVHLRIMDIAPR